MATASEIINRIAEEVEDDGFTNADILDLLNQGRAELSVEFDLPSLKTSDTVTTTAESSSVALPDNYHKGLFWVGSAVQRKRIGTRKGDYHNLLSFLEKYPTLNNTGNIEAVCVDGENLLYQGMCADTLTLRFYEKVVDIDIDDIETESPDELPPFLQKRLLVSYCVHEIYEDIEDSSEESRANAKYWEGRLNKAKFALSNFIRESEPREPKYVRDTE